MGVSSNTHCWVLRRDLKPTAMFLFERASAAKGKNREGGSGQNFRQEIYAGQTIVDSA